MDIVWQGIESIKNIYLTTEIISFSAKRMHLLNNAVDYRKTYTIMPSHMHLLTYLLWHSWASKHLDTTMKEFHV